MKGSRTIAFVALAIWFAMLVGGISGCAMTNTCIATDPTNLPCTCNGTQNPACAPPLTDAKKPDGGAKR